MLARIVKHGDGDWRGTNAAFEKVALWRSNLVRGLQMQMTMSDILDERPIVKSQIMRSTRREITSRQIAAKVIEAYL